MSNYFVIDFKKINTKEAYKNIIVGHNNRKRNYKNRLNIDTSKSKDNIILSPLKYKSASELINTANQIIKQENEKIKEKNKVTNKKEKLKRGLKKGSAFAFNIVVDCSVIEEWSKEDYIKYLKDAEKWLQNRFKEQEIISSVIHLDESKPHLHITFSYYNKNLKKWNQMGLKEQKLTNLNILLKDFERDIGKKYGLKKGDNKDIKKQLSVNAKKIFGNKIETYKVKESLFSTKEVKAISVNNINKCLTTYYNKIIKKVNQKVPEIGQVERLKEEYNKKVAELERTNEELLNMLNEYIQEYNKELQKTLRTIKNIKEKHKKELYEKNMLIKQLQDKVKELESLIPPPKKQDFRGLDF
jgi:predicted nuclease with TOPRIM domain